MKIALLLGISKYDKSLSNLPASETETEHMGKILISTGKYDDVLVITNKTTSAEIKNQISSWIESYQKSKIDEVFFYYSGHGNFINGELHFPLSDFDRNKLRQTSLTNSEVDSWLRSLQPELAIKVVDACHAGVPYIKDDTATFNKYLEKSSSGYNKCYFMFSSEVDQSSYQDDDFSFFTRYFIDALKQHNSENIRYRDIIDFISDKFSKDSLQTPFFVIQANNTELFAKRTSDMLKIFDEGDIIIETSDENESAQSIDTEPENLLQAIQKEAEIFYEENEVRGILDELKINIESFKYAQEFIDVYEVEYSYSDNERNIPQNEVIGEWINKNEHQFFAEPTYGTEEYKVRERSNTIEGMIQGGYVTRTKTREVLDGYKVTDYSKDYTSIQVEAKSKYPNIPWNNCTIAIIYSKISIRFFYFYAEYKETNWSTRDLITPVNWQTMECKFRDSENLWLMVESVQAKFSEEIITRLKENFGFNHNKEQPNPA